MAIFSGAYPLSSKTLIRALSEEIEIPFLLEQLVLIVLHVVFHIIQKSSTDWVVVKGREEKWNDNPLERQLSKPAFNCG